MQSIYILFEYIGEIKASQFCAIYTVEHEYFMFGAYTVFCFISLKLLYLKVYY
jgi:hypothetical protein